MAASTNMSLMHRGLLTLGALVLPATILSAYLAMPRWLNPWINSWVDFIALGLGVAVGAVCIWKLMASSRWRPLAMVAYVLVCVAAQFVYGIGFVCAVFEECL